MEAVPKLRNLKRLREGQYLTQQELAEKAGITRVAVARLEGLKAEARFKTLRALAEALGVQPGELVGE